MGVDRGWGGRSVRDRPDCKDAYNQNRFIPGHEIAGIVRGTDKTEQLNVGDRVVVYPFIGCNNCFSCKNKLWKARIW